MEVKATPRKQSNRFDHFLTFKETLNKLMSDDNAEGWTSFDKLPVLKNMSPADVEQEIRVRRYGHRLIYRVSHIEMGKVIWL